MKFVFPKYQIISTVCLAILVLFFACKKKDSGYALNSITLVKQDANNGIKLTWDLVNSSDFVRYEIYRSDNPIPIPTPKVPINPNLLITTISNSDNNFFIDSVSFGNSYYMVQVVLKLRNLVSNSVNSKNGFSMSGSFINAYIDKSHHNVYVRNSSTNRMTIYNYELDSVLALNKDFGSGTNFVTNNESNTPAIYSNEFSNYVSEYDATSLNLVKVHTIPINSNSFTISNGMLYLNRYPDSLVTFNLGNDQQVDSDVSLNSGKLNISPTGNAIVTTGFSSFGNANYFSIGSDKKPQLLHVNTDNHSLFNYCQLSPNGTYIISNVNGNTVSLLHKDLSLKGSLDNPSFSSYFDFAFTGDEKYLLALTSFSTIEVYDVNTLKFVTSIPLTNSFFSSQPKIFVDGYKLISVENTFNQFTGQSVILIRHRTLQF